MVLPIVVFAVAAVVSLWLIAAVGSLVFSFLGWILMGLVTGWVASRLMGTRLTPGWTIGAGIVGSWIGGALLAAAHLHAPLLLGSLLHLAASVLGAAILIAFARVVARPALTGGSRPRLGRTY